MASTLAGMYSVADLVGRLRVALADLVDPYTWDDASLGDCIQQAVTEHSYQFPAQAAHRFSVGAGAQVFDITAKDPTVAEEGSLGDAVNAEVITITRVELPVGTPLPADPGQSTDPAGSSSTRYKQGYRARGGRITLTNPASGPEVGTFTMRVEWLQTYNLPYDAGLSSVPWNGPVLDVPLLLLYAKRAAYQRLGEWQARDGIVLQQARAVNVESLVALLDKELDRAIAVRRLRNVRGRTLDI
jgi:hypothetical protein